MKKIKVIILCAVVALATTACNFNNKVTYTDAATYQYHYDIPAQYDVVIGSCWYTDEDGGHLKLDFSKGEP